MADISQLVQNALNGDRASFDALYTETNRAVYFTCLGFLKNEEDALDVMQDVYIAAFDKLGTLKDPQTFPAWVKRIAVNRCKNFLVKKNAHYEQSIDSEENITELVDENFLPEEYAESEEKRRIVMKIVRDVLSDTLYQTVMMFYFDELTIAEIAEIMDCPEGTVKYRLNAARVKIKKGVLDYENKNDERLHAVVMIPFLTRLFAEISKNTDVPQIPIENVLPKANSAPDTTQTVTNGGKKMLNSLKSKVIAGVCAAVVVGGGITAAVLISKNAAKPTGTVTSRPTVTYSARPNSVVGGNTSKPSVSTPSAESTPEQMTFTATDEIKNAAFDSGLIQINNEVFQQGGYITVAELVEKYKDTYDITYEDGTYEERKDYLLEYKEPNDSFGSYDRSGQLLGNILELTPKTGNNKELRSIYAVIGNYTSPEEKITIDKGIVIGYNFAHGPVTSSGSSARTVHSAWLPQGIGLTSMLNHAKNHLREVPDDLKEANENYTLKSFTELLNQQGFSLSEKIPGSFSASKAEEYYKKYRVVSNSNYIKAYGVGETNLFGSKPVYEYTIFFDSNTDKMSETRFALVGFIE